MTSRKLGKYPNDVSAFATENGLEAIIEEMLLPELVPAKPFIRRDETIRTQGSCFARNIAEALTIQGVQAECTDVPEVVNSPLANRIFFDYMLHPTAAYVHPLHARLISPEGRVRNFEQLKQAKALILTVGLAYVWYDRNTGLPSIAIDERDLGSYEHRYADVNENAGHIRGIIASLRKINPSLKIVITLSPVPLNSVFNGRSAINCDTISKATLRVAIEQYFQSPDPEVYYWPAFEIVRSLAIHTAPTFGADDSNARHVNKSAVALVVRLFSKYFVEP